METVAVSASAPRVMVVDDEEDITTVLGDILGDQGYAVTAASDGAEAWAMAQAEPFDASLPSRLSFKTIESKASRARSPGGSSSTPRGEKSNSPGNG